jgi:hypothetical protein
VGIWGRSGAAVLALAFLVAGCSRDNEPQKLNASTAQVSLGPEAQPDVNNNGTPDASPEDDDWPGKMIPTYEPATSPEAITGRDLIQPAHLLENLADTINETLKLPFDIPLIGKQCDTANAFWDSSDNTVNICYEDAADGLDIYTDAGDPDPRASAINAETATFFHETGHMVISLYDLPTTGREEDVADQLSAYILLAPGEDGKPDPDSMKAVKDFAREFDGYSKQKGGEISEGELADVHSLDKTRMYNLECWVYGADPDSNGDLVGDDLLPQDRADGCEHEFEKLSSSWNTLLGPYVKS